MALADEALDGDYKKFLKGLSVRHTSKHVFGKHKRSKYNDNSGRIGNESLATQNTLHPIVIKHPLSGRPRQYASPKFT